MKMRLFVDSDEFWSNLKEDTQNSEDYIYIQTLSFEGDSIGKMVSNHLLSLMPKDVRILADLYTKYIISDKFYYKPKNFFDKDVRLERKETIKMVNELNQHGVKVKYTNPVGPMLMRFLARNHKKMVLIDDRISYIGGINFSDHNFEWHDLMMRIDDPDITKFLKSDFLAMWEGRHVCSEKDFGDIRFYICDGHTNKKTFQILFDLIEGAKKSIFIESAYASFPFYEKLRSAQNCGAKITIITPKENNYKHVQRYTLWEAERSGFDLWLYQANMTHVKAMLIDESFLVLGSTNFDYISYSVEQELFVIITNSEIINEFKNRVIEPDLLKSKKFAGEIIYKSGFLHYIGLQAIGAICTFPAKILPASRRSI
jgi:cardiolipin synthase A/B